MESGFLQSKGIRPFEIQLLKIQITNQNLYNSPNLGAGAFTQSIVFEHFCHLDIKINYIADY